MAGKKFDMTVAYNAFSQAKIEDDDQVFIDEYIKGYAELCRFMDMLGTVFTFVTSDVRSKLHILEQHRSSDVGESYKTVQSMLQYEMENDITIVKDKHLPPSGARTLLRLHRALIFILLFLEKILEVQPAEKLSGIASTAYNETLANYHPWLIRKGVGMAMYTLPTREHLLQKMDSEHSEEHMAGLIQKTVQVGHPIYASIQQAYEQHKLLDLP